MGGQLQMLEAAVEPPGWNGAGSGQCVLLEPEKGVEEGFEVSLPDQGGAVPGPVQQIGHRRRVDRKRDAVHPHPVGTRVLTGQDG